MHQMCIFNVCFSIKTQCVFNIVPPHIFRVRKIAMRIKRAVRLLNVSQYRVHTMGDGRKTARMRLLIFYKRRKKLSSKLETIV